MLSDILQSATAEHLANLATRWRRRAHSDGTDGRIGWQWAYAYSAAVYEQSIRRAKNPLDAYLFREQRDRAVSNFYSRGQR